MGKTLLLGLFLCFSFLSAVTVLIDPGHGGRFDGCLSSSGKYKEKDLVLAIAHEVAAQLKNRGFTTILTRNGDFDFLNGAAAAEDEVYKDLGQRQLLIKKIKPNLFISLHLNSNVQKSVRGFEIFVPYQDKFPTKSYQLAAAIHHALSHSLEQKWSGTLGNLNLYDRGIRAAKFLMLRNLSCPGVLIEIDYLTNLEIEKLCADKNYINKVAQAIANGIISYCTKKY